MEESRDFGIFGSLLKKAGSPCKNSRGREV